MTHLNHTHIHGTQVVASRIIFPIIWAEGIRAVFMPWLVAKPSSTVAASMPQVLCEMVQQTWVVRTKWCSEHGPHLHTRGSCACNGAADLVSARETMVLQAWSVRVRWCSKAGLRLHTWLVRLK